MLTIIMSKNDTISKVYYDPAGYGSVKNTWLDAKKKGPIITIKDVRVWFANHVDQKNDLGVKPVS